MYTNPIFLRTYRTPSQVLKRDFYFPKNPYPEEKGRLHFLHQKPLCILLLGKPCTGKTTLAKKLCRRWKLQLVNATELIKDYLNSNNEVGRQLNDILINGSVLTDEIVFNLINEKLSSPECAHYGYILDDFPTFGKTSINPEKQMKYILSLKLKPDYIIKIQLDEDDLNERRRSLRIDYEDGTLYTSRNYEPEPQLLHEPQEQIFPATGLRMTTEPGDQPATGEDAQALDDEAMEEEQDHEARMEPGHPDFPKLNKTIRERLYQRCEEFSDYLFEDSQYYRENVSHHLKQLIGQYNPLNVIELDGNQSPTEMFYNLMLRLQAMNLYPSVAPVRFYPAPGAEEEDATPEDMDTDELFQTLATKKMPGPRCRWQRSPWQRFCPVALYQGNLAYGKPEFSVGFLGQIFCLSTPDNFLEFVRNPRPYLLPPQPRHPFRLVLVGPTASGKSTVIRLLAERYSARVIDLAGMLQEEHDSVLSKRLAEVEAEIEAEVIAEVKQRHELEVKTLRENKMVQDATDNVTGTVAKELEQEAVEKLVADVEEESGEPTEESEKVDSNIISLSLGSPASKPLEFYTPKHLLIPVDKNHPEVKTRVREALHKARQQPVELDVNLYLDAVRAAVEEAEDQLRMENPGGPFRGNWIIDGLPVRPAVWRHFTEKAPGLLPDMIVGLIDGSEKYEFLLRRWYKLKCEGFNVVKETQSEESTDKEVTEDIGSTSESLNIPQEQKDPLPPPGRVTDAALGKLKEYEKQWTQTADLIQSSSNEFGVRLEALSVDIAEKTFEQIRDEILAVLEKPFRVTPVEVTLAELEEQEEEDAAAFEEEIDEAEEMNEGDEEEAEEEAENEDIDEGAEAVEEEEEVDPSRNMDKRLGLTSYFCPVTVHDYGLLRPGNPEIGVIYQGEVYYFVTEEARSRFVHDPQSILNDTEKPICVPPPRMLLLGPSGGGKTLHGRQLAATLDLFYINFECILQEIVMPKTGKKLGKEYEDEQPIPDVVLPPLHEGDSPNSDLETPVTPKLSEPASTRIDKEDLTEHENNVVEYLINVIPLPDTTLEWILAKYWTLEPYRSKGFILEGFPTSGEQLQFMVNANLIPDLVIVLNLESDEVVARLLPVRMENWRKRMAKKAENATKLKDWKAKKRMLAMEKRRAELLRELQEKRANARVSRSVSDVENEEDEELDDEMDLDDLLAKEMEEGEEEMDMEEEETEADAIDRLTEEITERYDEQTDSLSELLDQLEEISVPKVEIDSGGKVTWVRYRLVKRINALISNRQSLFERVYPVTPKIAERLIANAYRFPSRFGRWCPVTLQISSAWLPPVSMPAVKVPNAKWIGALPGDSLPLAKPNTCAAVYRDNVYWFANPAARVMFMKNPLKFVQKQVEPPVMIPLRLAVLGPPKAGKTTFIKRLVQEFQVPSIKPVDAIRWILYDPSHAMTSLAKRIRVQMENGNAVSDSLIATTIQVLTMNSIYYTRGYILDGYPITMEQAQLLNLEGVRPALMVELIAPSDNDEKELIMRGMQDAVEDVAKLNSTLGLSMSPDAYSGAILKSTTVAVEQETDELADSSPRDDGETRRPEEGFQPLRPDVDMMASELAVKLHAYEESAAKRRNWTAEHQGILVDLYAVQNRWKLWHQFRILIGHRMQHIQKYMENILKNKAASIAELGIKEWQFKLHASDYGNYCPVSLQERDELVETMREPRHEFFITIGQQQQQQQQQHQQQPLVDFASELSTNTSNQLLKSTIDSLESRDTDTIRIPTTMRFTAEFRGRYYRMAGPEELQKFLANPMRYLPPMANRTLPKESQLPKRVPSDSSLLSRDAFPTQMALRGYCPVCFVQGNQLYEGLKLGLREYLAQYEETIFTFCSNECLLAFLGKPKLYQNLTLPHKLPPMPSPIDVHTLPLPGFLEQTVSIALRMALSAVGQERPKFPFLKIKRSALIFVGLHLKGYNPRSPEFEKQKYQQKLRDYSDMCRLPIWLRKSMPLRFKPEPDRVPGLTARLEEFLSLQRFEDRRETWLEIGNGMGKQQPTEPPAARGIRLLLSNPFQL